MRYSAVLLDLDGTLVDSIPDIAAAANAMLVDLGRNELSLQVITSFVGKGTDVLVQRTLLHDSGESTFDAIEYEQARTLFAQHYESVNGEKSIAYDGVFEGLSAFKAMGCKLAVVTNKPIGFTIPLLNKLRLASYFDVVVGGDTTPEKKPHPLPFTYACEQLNIAPGQCLAVGDSINDALAARAAKIDVLVVPYGYNEGIDVQTLDVDGIVSSIADAARWARKSPTI
ncbi:phosphoglycolate phosphatase [Paenalcaligenes niemegkensis]|uniref:phosphoglycolate phosphatase n=1 Tax=Paenalcaligenes niemegkensis TaxID=2895469 RepID=UPI001EE85CBB|nr:phosphoglycolate phosphatase [Paenalcaligenes niemegkensis]MCQ9617604.1 phosphoglycolate phosphatase [Paenalcaligenes niemegkensis]